MYSLDQFQFKYLRDAVDKNLEMTMKKEALVMGSPEGSASEMVELQDQIVKLKALLATKREQVSSFDDPNSERLVEFYH
jgi:hypothetical protein